MSDNFGISFSPFGDPNDPSKRNQGGETGGGPTPQEAIRVLSLRVPRTVGVASPIPSMLLNAQGGAGFAPAQGSVPGNALEELLRRLFGTQQGQPGMTMPGQMGRTAAPAPRTTPIDTRPPMPWENEPPAPPRADATAPGIPTDTTTPRDPMSREPMDRGPRKV